MFGVFAFLTVTGATIAGTSIGGHSGEKAGWIDGALVGFLIGSGIVWMTVLSSHVYYDRR